MTINQLVKNTVERLKKESKAWTPSAYSEAFCLEAKKAGFVVEDCNEIDRFLVAMDKKTAEEVKQYRVKTTAELIRFLISKISRLNPTEASILVEQLSLLARNMAEASLMLHNKEVNELSKKTITLIEEQASASQIELLKQAWENFLKIYDDSFLQKLSEFGKVDKNNLKKTIESLEFEKLNVTGSDYSAIAIAIVSSLAPSIAPAMSSDIVKLSTKISSHPALLSDKDVLEEIKNAVAMRIMLDKNTVSDMTNNLNLLLGRLSSQLIDLIERSESSSSEIQSVKRELSSLKDLKGDDFKIAHKKLYTIATTLEEKVELLGVDLKTHNEKVMTMSKKIEALEAELQMANAVSREDFLTKIYNKRALDEQLNIKESEFSRHGDDFCVAMIDLDFFKKINDTYGHDAGDAVLVAFSKMLKSESRACDIVGRWGGEEFMAILCHSDIEGARAFCEKIRKHVEAAHFLYQGKRIDVSVSIGIAQRSKFSSLTATTKNADEMLYKAKQKGRNRVEPS